MNCVNPNQLDKVTSSFVNKNAWQWTWKTGHRLETNRCEVCYWYYHHKERGNFSHFPDLPKNKRGDYFWQLLSKWIVSGDPHSKLFRSETQNSNYILHAGNSAQVPLSAATLILCRSFYNPPWLQPSCQRRPSFRHHTFAQMLSHWNIELHLNVRSLMLAAKSEHSDNPTMGRAEKLL